MGKDVYNFNKFANALDSICKEESDLFFIVLPVAMFNELISYFIKEEYNNYFIKTNNHKFSVFSSVEAKHFFVGKGCKCSFKYEYFNNNNECADNGIKKEKQNN